jgi:hypothetical protein
MNQFVHAQLLLCITGGDRKSKSEPAVIPQALIEYLGIFSKKKIITHYLKMINW